MVFVFIFVYPTNNAFCSWAAKCTHNYQRYLQNLQILELSNPIQHVEEAVSELNPQQKLPENGAIYKANASRETNLWKGYPLYKK